MDYINVDGSLVCPKSQILLSQKKTLTETEQYALSDVSFLHSFRRHHTLPC